MGTNKQNQSPPSNKRGFTKQQHNDILANNVHDLWNDNTPDDVTDRTCPSCCRHWGGWQLLDIGLRWLIEYLSEI